MVCRLERTLFYRVKLDALDLDLKNRRKSGNRAILFSLGILDADLLSIESAINGRVDVLWTMRYINLNIAPPFLFGSGASCSGDVGSGSTIEETDDCQ